MKVGPNVVMTVVSVLCDGELCDCLLLIGAGGSGAAVSSPLYSTLPLLFSVYSSQFELNSPLDYFSFDQISLGSLRCFVAKKFQVKRM